MNKLFYLVAIFLATSTFCSSQDTVRFKRFNHAFYAFPGSNPASGLRLSVSVTTLMNRKIDSSGVLRAPTIRNSINVTQIGQFGYKNQVDLFPKNKVHINMILDLLYANGLYYGVGNVTYSQNRVTFRSENIGIQGTIEKKVYKNLFVGIALNSRYDNYYGYRHKDSLNIERFEPRVAKDGGFITGIGPSIYYDSRDYTLYPTKGFFISVAYRHFPKFTSDFLFWDVNTEIRFFHKIKNEKNIFAYQIKHSSQAGDVPFYFLNKLGGSNSLRGFNSLRHLDSHTSYAQVEYRKYLKGRFRIHFFTGAGKAYRNIPGFNKEKWHAMLGTGLRFELIKGKKLNARLDLVYIGGKPEFPPVYYLGLNESL